MKKKEEGGGGIKENKYFFPVDWGTKLTRVFFVPSLEWFWVSLKPFWGAAAGSYT